MKKIIVLYFVLIAGVSLHAQYNRGSARMRNSKVIPGAERTDQYLPLLKGKNVAVFANQTSLVGKDHLVDVMLKNNIAVKKIFSPEHGFRGDADAGKKMNNTKDEKTGIPIVSLYGDKRKPTVEDLKDVDIMLFDIQDVGVRFYTYISSLQYYLEAAMENGKHLIVLDRPNPNGFYVDGPVLDPEFKSFVGMQPIPVVYGMTIGEYSQMLIGEEWYDKGAFRYRKDATEFEFTVIPCLHYDHKTFYELPVKPSPNLPDMQSIYLYPSTCFFEGTVLSEGRGTDRPFQVFGHPSLPSDLYKFTPVSKPGATNPKLKDKVCYGWNLGGTKEKVLEEVDNRMQLKWLLEAFKLFPDKDHFFNSNNGFNRLAGNNELMQQIKDGKTEEEIRKSWEPRLNEFKEIRKKYLLYKDFTPNP